MKRIEASNCSNSEDVIREMEREMTGDDWGRDKRGFGQHMLEEDRVRIDWESGKFEQNMACHTCGDKHAWINCITVAKNSHMQHGMI